MREKVNDGKFMLAMIHINYKELFEIIEKAVNGDIKAKFEIIIIFESLIKSKAYIKGKFNGKTQI